MLKRLLLNEIPSDILCWNAFRAGDRQAFEHLFRKYHPVLFQYGTKICNDQDQVNDCIQDLFVEIWQSNANTPVQSVKAYLLRSLKYKLFRQFKSVRPMHDVEAWEENVPFELSHDHFIERREEERSRATQVTQAVSNLPSRQKEIIYLKIYQQLSYEEISEVMGINYQVARNLFSQSLKTLRSLI